MNRAFRAEHPNRLRVSDFTYVPTWSGTVHVAFVIDVFARRIVGWHVSGSISTRFVLDALNQAIFQRKTPTNKDLVHHSDRGARYLSITCAERLAEAGIDPSVGTVGDSYDNALAESVIGLFKTEVINALSWRQSPVACGTPRGTARWHTCPESNWIPSEVRLNQWLAVDWLGNLDSRNSQNDMQHIDLVQ